MPHGVLIPHGAPYGSVLQRMLIPRGGRAVRLAQSVGACWSATPPPVALLFSLRGYGAVAQLGEHLVCNQGVVGSNPIRSM